MKNKQLDLMVQRYYSDKILESFNIFTHDILQDSKLKSFDSESYKALTEENFNNEMKQYEDLQTFIESISLSYSNSHENYAANATLQENKINFNVNKFPSLTFTLIHEFSHLAIYYFSKKEITGHTLEFAIFNHCLQNKYKDKFNTGISLDNTNIHKKEKKTFFNSYDIHEDPSIAILKINVLQYDSMILNLQFTDLFDLYNKCYKYANKIRNIATQL